MMDARLHLDLADIVKTMGALAAHAPEAIKKSVQLDVENMIGDVVKNRMTGQVLGVVTGTARRSMAGVAGGSKAPPGAAAIKAVAAQRTEARLNMVRAEWGSPLAYVRAHEEGASGAAWVPEHTRRTPSGGVASVRAHARAVNVLAKHFMRATFFEQAYKVAIRAKRALLLLAMTGRVPKASDLYGVR